VALPDISDVGKHTPLTRQALEVLKSIATDTYKSPEERKAEAEAAQRADTDRAPEEEGSAQPDEPETTPSQVQVSEPETAPETAKAVEADRAPEEDGSAQSED